MLQMELFFKIDYQNHRYGFEAAIQHDLTRWRLSDIHGLHYAMVRRVYVDEN